MIRDALIFMCGVWTGVIIGFFLAGAALNSRRADDQAERELSELDNSEPLVRVERVNLNRSEP
jgi:hypothetical protein